MESFLFDRSHRVEVEPARTNVLDGVTVIRPATTNLVLVLTPKPTVQTALEVAKAMPDQTGAPLAATLAALLLSGFANYRQHRANRRRRKLAEGLVRSVESGRSLLRVKNPELDTAFRNRLIEHQGMEGVLEQASELVRELTKKGR